MILVTGGTGVMGTLLVRKLHERACRIRTLSLPNDPGVERIKKYAEDIRFGDMARQSDVKDLCRSVDTVIHCAAIIVSPDDALFDRINVGGTRNILESARQAGVGHFIYLSSASVVYPKTTPYAASKRKCEELVKASGLPYTIIRPTLVYDVGKGGLEFDMYLSYLKKYPVVPFVGRGGAVKRPIFCEDIIKGLTAIPGNRQTCGKTYNFSGAEPLSMMDFSRLCLRLLGTPKKPVAPLPVWFCQLLAVIMKRVMKNPPLKWQVIAGITQDANLDPADAMREIGYAPSAVTEKLKECFPRVP